MGAESFNKQELVEYCMVLSKTEPIFRDIIRQYGYPPFWSRPANFETVVHIILEQQVSLASALAALNKLKERIGSITPAALLSLSDEEMRACYFSRQKTGYVRHLAHIIQESQLHIETLGEMADEDIAQSLMKIKGIGKWTVDVFMMMVLHRCDYFPIGDIALVNSMKTELGWARETSKEQLLTYADRWRPYRTVAAFLLWHVYLCKQNKDWTKKAELGIIP
jgi:DNA-3-methyladenine glycosylase II